VDFKKAYDSVRREVLYDIRIEIGVPMKPVRPITRKMCLNKKYNKLHVGKYLSDNFPIQNGLNKEMVYHHYFSTLLYNKPLGVSRKTRWN
jgi:hypothetical protein